MNRGQEPWLTNIRAQFGPELQALVRTMRAEDGEDPCAVFSDDDGETRLFVVAMGDREATMLLANLTAVQVVERLAGMRAVGLRMERWEYSYPEPQAAH